MDVEQTELLSSVKAYKYCHRFKNTITSLKYYYRFKNSKATYKYYFAHFSSLKDWLPSTTSELGHIAFALFSNAAFWARICSSSFIALFVRSINMFSVSTLASKFFISSQESSLAKIIFLAPGCNSINEQAVMRNVAKTNERDNDFCVLNWVNLAINLSFHRSE